jgi:2-iminobutanoate/2-iminopropanoate deaminase
MAAPAAGRSDEMSDIHLVKPSPHFPFSHATVHGEIVYVSGQVGFAPGTTQVVSDDLRDQCRQTFRAIDEILAAAGSSKERIIRCGVYLRHVERDFAAFNECYAAWLGSHRPARSTIQAGFALPGILVEVDCIASTGPAGLR